MLLIPDIFEDSVLYKNYMHMLLISIVTKQELTEMFLRCEYNMDVLRIIILHIGTANIAMDNCMSVRLHQELLEMVQYLRPEIQLV